MKLLVTHKTDYHYGQSLQRIIQSYRLNPSHSSSQTILQWDVVVEGGTLTKGARDAAGDLTRTMNMNFPKKQAEQDGGCVISISIKGLVETNDTNGVLADYRETISPLVYLKQTALTKADAAITDLAHQPKSPAKTPPKTLDLAHELCQLASKSIAYLPDTTHHDVSAAEALKLGQGVCQDQTHLLISMARLHDLPARYVVGYLHSDASGNSHEATHAWAEIYIAELGWIGFDSTNIVCPDARYIRLCSGLDAHHAAPIRGVIFGTGA